MTCNKPHSGFSLVELLVTVAVLAVTLGLLLPAVHRLREASLKLRCAGNLKQLSIAAHTYHSVVGHLPPGCLGPTPVGTYPSSVKNYQHVGVLAFLLPYLEADASFRGIGVSLDLDCPSLDKGDRNLYWWADEKTVNRSQLRISILRCPSDDPYLASTTVITGIWPSKTNEASTSAISLSVQGGGQLNPLAEAVSECINPGRTNYVGNLGVIGRIGGQFDRFAGPFDNRSRIRFSDFKDAKSMTLFFGEALGGTRYGGDDETSFSWMGAGSLPTYWGFDEPMSSDWYRFSSSHVSGIQFAFADGSVRCLPRSMNTDSVLFSLSGYRDAVYIPDEGVD